MKDRRSPAKKSVKDCRCPSGALGSVKDVRAPRLQERRPAVLHELRCCGALLVEAPPSSSSAGATESDLRALGNLEASQEFRGTISWSSPTVDCRRPALFCSGRSSSSISPSSSTPGSWSGSFCICSTTSDQDRRGNAAKDHERRGRNAVLVARSPEARLSSVLTMLIAVFWFGYKYNRPGCSGRGTRAPTPLTE